MSRKRFERFINDIAYGEAEWEYANGDSIRTDAMNFIKYLRKLETNQRTINQDAVSCNAENGKNKIRSFGWS